ncbi:hypothetical protein ISCGN_026191 [Ixodes scapularis]
MNAVLEAHRRPSDLPRSQQTGENVQAFLRSGNTLGSRKPKDMRPRREESAGQRPFKRPANVGRGPATRPSRNPTVAHDVNAFFPALPKWTPTRRAPRTQLPSLRKRKPLQSWMRAAPTPPTPRGTSGHVFGTANLHGVDGVFGRRRGCVAVGGGGADIARRNPYVGNVGKSAPLKEADFFGTPVF